MNNTSNSEIGAEVLHEENVKHLDAVEADMERARALTALERATAELELAKSIVDDSPEHVAHIAELQAIADAAEIAELKTMDNNYTLKTWETPTSQPETRTGLPYAFAHAMATKGGQYKVQVIWEDFDTIELEVKNSGVWQ